MAEAAWRKAALSQAEGKLLDLFSSVVDFFLTQRQLLSSHEIKQFRNIVSLIVVDLDFSINNQTSAMILHNIKNIIKPFYQRVDVKSPPPGL